MKTEIEQAVKYLSQGYLPKNYSRDKVEQFELLLSTALERRFEGHWDPSRPHVGNAFRAVSINAGRCDSLLQSVITEIGLAKSDNHFPADLCIWIDPHCVSYKVGEYGIAQNLYCDERSLEILDLPVYFKGLSNNRARSPYGTNGTVSYTSPPAPTQQSSPGTLSMSATLSSPQQQRSPPFQAGRSSLGYQLVSAQ
ncbi:hypothetical protein SmJEL517_g01335 [Synchytrium microbalum]|uniref:Anti-proliferative protein domain-containing protein n=1 Tax=Synchytrium microbalum TaxID=1806994 RepID=A0A507CBH7_9FUNG|nr:uncharacterized protein SmJEL517_g01335 [Synchytrium microbalum]TPX36499.1 hypothetical protein SmJEL517_g01335 [Synchytrium microbalum]